MKSRTAHITRPLRTSINRLAYARARATAAQIARQLEQQALELLARGATEAQVMDALHQHDASSQQR